jgi:hypothetical protein
MDRDLRVATRGKCMQKKKDKEKKKKKENTEH